MAPPDDARPSWFKRMFTRRAPAQEPVRAPFELDINGRPIRPRLDAGPIPQETDDAVRELMLDWAIAWVGEPVDDRTHLRDLLDEGLHGQPPRRKADRIAAVRMAVKGVRTICQEARARRTKDAFPYCELKVGPQVDPCTCATSLADRLIPFTELPVIPLPGCTAPSCRCRFRQVTKAEAKRRVGAPEK